jgi:AcrR family transcriptional regulator
MNDRSFIIARTMPRKRSIPDQDLLDAALVIVRADGPDALSFGTLAPQVGLAPSTIVQRFGSRPALLQAALRRAWDLFDAATAAAIEAAPDGPAGVVDLLVRLSGTYDPDDAYADQLLLLREDLRDPVLRARGRAWLATLTDAIEQRLGAVPGGPAGLGDLVVAHWQGALTVWAFQRTTSLPVAVRAALERLFERLGAPATRPRRRSSGREPPARSR